MDFQLTEEQQMLKDSARRFLEEQCAFDARAALVAQGAYDAGRWRTMADLGWLGMAIPEEQGGLGTSAIETALLMEEMGRVLCVEPYWAVAVLTAQTIAAAGDAAWAERLLPDLAGGAALPVLAHGEHAARGLLSHVATTATPDGTGKWVLAGKKSLIVGGNVADSFIVSARTSGNLTGKHGITLFVVPRNAPGLTVRHVRLLDNRWCADIEFDNVCIEAGGLLGGIGDAYGALDHGHAHAMIGLCAEAIGVMEKALWLTRDYLKVRKQFGVTLNTFQALQHRMSEMLIELELSRGMLHKALSCMGLPEEERQRALSAAKIHIGRSGKFVCGQAIQLHGGIGVTEEYVVGHHFKRMTTIEYALGSSHFHLERLAGHERRQAA